VLEDRAWKLNDVVPSMLSCRPIPLVSARARSARDNVVFRRCSLLIASAECLAQTHVQNNATMVR